VSLQTKLAVLKYYKVDDDGAEKLTRMRRQCPQCGAGVCYSPCSSHPALSVNCCLSACCVTGNFMAQHFDRQHCGKCHLTYMYKNGEGKTE